MARMNSPEAWSKPAASAEVWPKLRRSLMTSTRLIDRGNLFHQLVGAVARAIVHQHQLKTLAHLLHHLLQARIEDGNVLLFVVKRNDNRILRHINSIDAAGLRRVQKRGVRSCAFAAECR